MLYSCIASSHPGVKPDTILESGGGGGGGDTKKMFETMNFREP